MASVNPRQAAGVLVIIERPDLRVIVCRTQDDVAGGLELGQTARDGVGGSAGEADLGGPVLLGAVWPALVIGLAREGRVEVEVHRGRDSAEIAHIREEIE